MLEIYLVILSNFNLCVNISKGNYGPCSTFPLTVLEFKNLTLKQLVYCWISSYHHDMIGVMSRSQKELLVPPGIILP